MQVNTVNATSAATDASNTTASASPGTNLDYNAFLQLLIAELKNQDPTKPMDSAQYIAQLAGFSNVEQSVKLNGKIDTLIAGQSIAQANSLIGKTVTSADGSISGKVMSVHITDSGMIAELIGGKTVDLVTGIKVQA
jgi:flagellar basal-body rod modification protein FlgD